MSVVGRRRPPTSRSGRDVGLRRVPNRCAFLKGFSPNRAGEALLGHGELLQGSSERFEVLEVRGTCSLHEDVAWSGGNAERSPVFTFVAKCGTVEICVIFLDTLTPTYWGPASPVPVPHFRELGLESLKVLGMGLLCVRLQSRFDPFEVCPGVGIVVTTIVACGVPEWWHSFGYGCFRAGLVGRQIGPKALTGSSTCERDRGVRRVLNTTALVVAFLLPLFGSTSACAPCVTRGAGLADVRSGKATASHVAFRSRRRATSRSQPLCIFKGVFAEQSKGSSAWPGGAAVGFFRAVRGSGGAWGVFSP
ncbi:hypothetical protein Taro_021805 [Colocasia esculenta]|uniref:Uncharacterized protein n=1 Tax=Colocasia esculenta TaxID=4460 RepID=A0A843V9C3_COLES|nr:hypothetical protein [Colocasia esculenta]